MEGRHGRKAVPARTDRGTKEMRTKPKRREAGRLDRVGHLSGARTGLPEQRCGDLLLVHHGARDELQHAQPVGFGLAAAECELDRHGPLAAGGGDLAVGGTAFLLHTPPLGACGVSTWTQRGCQQTSSRHRRLGKTVTRGTTEMICT